MLEMWITIQIVPDTDVHGIIKSTRNRHWGELLYNSFSVLHVKNVRSLKRFDQQITRGGTKQQEKEKNTIEHGIKYSHRVKNAN